MPLISLIAAISNNFVIGDANRLIWDMPSDVEYYKNKVRDKAIIMGRKTAESEDMFLSEKQNILITQKVDFTKKGFLVKNTLTEAIDAALGNEVFITGGEQIYRLALPKADRLYITRIHTKVEGDAYFPKFEENAWQLSWQEFHQTDMQNPFDYTFQRYDRLK